MKEKVIVDGKECYYEEIPEYSRNEISEILLSGNHDLIPKVLVSLGLYSTDFKYASDIIFQYAKNLNINTKGVALLCIGYLAMRYYELPVHPTIDLIQEGLDSEDVFIKDQAYTAASQINSKLPDLAKFLKMDLYTYYGISKERWEWLKNLDEDFDEDDEGPP